MIRRRTFARSLLALLLVASGAAAQDTMPSTASSTGAMQSMRMHHMHDMSGVKGMHHMPATVTATDPATGMVEATAGSLALKLHFPPAAMKTLKPGDTITVHMGFSQP